MRELKRALATALFGLFVSCSSSGDGIGGTMTASAGNTSQAGLAGGGTQAGSAGAHGGVAGQLGEGGAVPGVGGEAGAAGGDSPVCDAQHPSACPRGMYVSLWADHAGQNVFAGETAQHLHILGDAAKEAPVLDFIAAHGITSLSLYDLHVILSDAALTTALEAFLVKARGRGVREVLAICDVTQSAWDEIAAEQKQSAIFDGLVTEIEFWTDNSFDQFKSTLAYVRGLNIQKGGERLPVAVYVGWPTAEQTAAMAPLVERLFVHAYVTSPDKAFPYAKQRLLDLAAANANQTNAVEVRPIFSAEGTTWSAGAEHFMGDWLAEHSLPEAEAALLAAWSAEPVDSLPPFGGFQYFDYFYLERYLK